MKKKMEHEMGSRIVYAFRVLRALGFGLVGFSVRLSELRV